MLEPLTDRALAYRCAKGEFQAFASAIELEPGHKLLCSPQEETRLVYEQLLVRYGEAERKLVELLSRTHSSS